MRGFKAFLSSLAAVTAVSLLLAGCGGSGALDEREERDPLVKRAQARKQAHDIDGAIELFNKALDRKPGMARAHLELGLIYDQDKEDFVRAIYHYERYLELRPDAEKRDIVEQLIQHAKMSFAASLPDKPSEAVREIAMLKQEIDALRGKLADLQGQSRPKDEAPEQAAATPAAAKPPVAGAGAAGTPPVEASSVASLQPAPPQAAVSTYTVVAGDTLSRISGKVYNDPSKWKMILEANRATLPTERQLKVGQVLVIPKP
jgi:nucleoid-associated protein YgaU